MFRYSLVVLVTGVLHGEVYSLSLKQAVDRALTENPEVVLARLDEQKALQKRPDHPRAFIPRLDVGSGLAYTNGYPQSVGGAAPSIVTAKASAFVFNRQQTYLVAQARENSRGAAFATGAKRDEVAFRVASLYLDLSRAGRFGETAAKQVESLRKVADAARARVSEGYEIPLEEKRAIVDLRRAEQRVQNIEADRDYAERSLAVVLGYTADDRVKATETEYNFGPVPENEAAEVEA